MPSKSRTNGARRPYLRSGFHSAKRGAAALMERAVDETVADADLSPVELEAREWTRAVVKRLGRKRVTPIVEDRILVAGALRIVVFTTLETVRDLAVRGRLVNKKRMIFRPVTREWPDLARKYLELAAPLDLPPELEDGPEIEKWIRDPSKRWNRRDRRGEALDAASASRTLDRGAASEGRAPERAQAASEEPQEPSAVNAGPQPGPERPEEETTWTV